MIVQVLETGRYRIDAADVPAVQRADAALAAAVGAGDADAYAAALRTLIDTIDDLGVAVADDDVVDTDVVLPPADTPLDQLTSYVDDPEEGLIPD